MKAALPPPSSSPTRGAGLQQRVGGDAIPVQAGEEAGAQTGLRGDQRLAAAQHCEAHLRGWEARMVCVGMGGGGGVWGRG